MARQQIARLRREIKHGPDALCVCMLLLCIGCSSRCQPVKAAGWKTPPSPLLWPQLVASAIRFYALKRIVSLHLRPIGLQVKQARLPNLRTSISRRLPAEAQFSLNISNISATRCSDLAGSSSSLVRQPSFPANRSGKKEIRFFSCLSPLLGGWLAKRCRIQVSLVFQHCDSRERKNLKVTAKPCLFCIKPH